mgnify:CR=1 FL=1
MSRLLFRLRGVPQDEAEEVRELLDEHAIEFYETHAGNWGISLPGLWVRNDAQFPEARRLLDIYQAERGERVRREHQLNKERCEAKTMWQSFREDPLRFTLYVGLAFAVLFFSLQFFVTL